MPQDATQFNWTVFCAGDGGGTCEGDSTDVRNIMNDGGNDTVVYVDDDIGPLNAGSHTTLLDNRPGVSLDHIGEAFRCRSSMTTATWSGSATLAHRRRRSTGQGHPWVLCLASQRRRIRH